MEMRSLLVDSHVVPLTELGDDEAKAALGNGSIHHKSSPFSVCLMSVCLSVHLSVRLSAFVNEYVRVCVCVCVCARVCVRACVSVLGHQKPNS